MSDLILDRATLDNLRELGDDLLGEVIVIFVSDAPKRIDEVEAAAHRNDPTTMWKAAHELRSVAANAGAMRLAQLCDVIQERGVDGSVEGAAQVVVDMRAAFEGAARELQKVR